MATTSPAQASASTYSAGDTIITPGFNPTAQAAATQGSYVSTTTLGNINLQKHDISETLIKRYGQQGLSGYLQSIGNMTAVGSDQFMHFEERMLHEELALVAVTAIGSNAGEMTFSVSAAHAKLLRLNAVIKFATGSLAIVTEVGAADGTGFKAKPYAATWSEWDTNEAGTITAFGTSKFVVIGLEFAKGTNQPTGIEPLVDKVEGRTAIFKESYAISGSDATQVVYVKVTSPATGKSGYVWYLKGEGDTRQRFEDYAEAQMLFMEKAAAATAGAGDNPLTGYEGLLARIMADGIEDITNNNDAIADATVDAWIDAFDKQRGAKEYTAWCGLNYNMAIDDWLASKNQHFAEGQNWGAFNNSKDMAMNLGFSSFNRAGYTFHKKNYDLFNDRGMGGSLGYRKKALFIPAGVSKDPKSGSNLPALAVRYREANGYSRKMEHWLTGSAILQTPNSTEDALRCHYRTERGLQVFGANRFMISSID